MVAHVLIVSPRGAPPHGHVPPFDLSDFDLSKVELPKFDLSKIEWPKFELPTFELPKVDLPEVDLPSVEQIAGFARDAAYVGIGLAVMTAERLQALQQQLLELLKHAARQGPRRRLTTVAPSSAPCRSGGTGAAVRVAGRCRAPCAASAGDNLGCLVSSPATTRTPLPEGTLPVAAALLVAGIATYAFFKVGTWAVGGEDAFNPISSLWFATFALAPGFFIPLEQELGRALAAPPRRSARAGSRSSAGSPASG